MCCSSGAATWAVPVQGTELQQLGWERGSATTGGGRKYTRPLVFAYASGTGVYAFPIRVYTTSRVRTREQLGCARVCKGIAGRCECGGRVRMYGAGNGGAGVDTAQTVGDDDGKLG